MWCARVGEAARAVFGGAQRRALHLGYVVTRPADVTVSLFRGKKGVLQSTVRERPAGVTQRLTIPARQLTRRGTYRVEIVARGGNATGRIELWARRL